MSSPLIDRLPNPLQAMYHSPQLLASYSANKNNILARKLYYAIDIEYYIRIMYVGDLIGLLMERAIPEKLHLLTMVLNDISDPADYDGQQTTLLIPHEEALEDIVVRHKTLD